jgi:Mg-chelatase subunit ChlD
MYVMDQNELKKYDYVIMVDKSGSMSTQDCPGGKSRWEFMYEQVMNISRVCAQFDDDGIDVVVFASKVKGYRGVTPDKVEQIFKENSPNNSTDTALAIQQVASEYFDRKRNNKMVKPCIVLCFTDGEPDSQSALKNVIIQTANKLDDEKELSFSFIQIGKDTKARAFLKQLDDDLQKEGAKFDIVDTKDSDEMENMTVEEILMEAVTD